MSSPVNIEQERHYIQYDLRDKIVSFEHRQKLGFTFKATFHDVDTAVIGKAELPRKLWRKKEGNHKNNVTSVMTGSKLKYVWNKTDKKENKFCTEKKRIIQ